MDRSVVATLAGQAWIAWLTLILLGLAAYLLRPRERADLKNDRNAEPTTGSIARALCLRLGLNDHRVFSS